jgi:hypothetical protein
MLFWRYNVNSTSEMRIASSLSRHWSNITEFWRKYLDVRKMTRMLAAVAMICRLLAGTL